MRPRTFELVRFRDLSGVSGTGVVAEGCVFTDGSVALRWRGNNPATAVWPDLESVLAVHGHQGATEVQWLDPDHFTPEPQFSTEPHLPPEPHVSTAGRLTPRPRPAATVPPAVAAVEQSFSGEPAFAGEPGFSVEPEGWSEPEAWAEAEGWVEAKAEEGRGEFELEQLLGGQHQVRPPRSIADPGGLPSAHARGWAGARHLR